jgi:phosphoribosylformylglycinamidine synthase
MKARIYVRLKQTVHDPQGQAIHEAFQHMGYTAFTGVRQGKVFDIEMGSMPEGEARKLLEEIGRKVLANPIIEEYSIELVQEPK